MSSDPRRFAGLVFVIAAALLLVAPAAVSRPATPAVPAVDPARVRATPEPLWVAQDAFRPFPLPSECDTFSDPDEPHITHLDPERGRADQSCHRVRWARLLRGLGEEPLQAGRGERIYRLIITDQHARGVRSYTVSWSNGQALAGIDHDRRTRRISAASLDRFERIVAATEFTAPLAAPPQPCGLEDCGVAIDPWMFILEAVVDGRYRMVSGILQDGFSGYDPIIAEMGRLVGERTGA